MNVFNYSAWGERLDNSQEFDAIVLGAGISGLVSAAILIEQGCESVFIADEYQHIGGNHIDWSSGGYTFDIGSLIFQDDSPLLVYFPELLPVYVPIEPSWARLTPQGIIATYPISIKHDIVGRGIAPLMRIAGSVIFARLFQRKMRNARDFARYWIGSYLLHQSGLESYMRRFYGVTPEEIDIDLAKKRMFWISEHASLLKILGRFLRSRRHGNVNNTQLARPKQGFRVLYQHAVERLEARGVEICLAAEMTGVTKVDNRFVLKLSDRTVRAARLVSTVPIERIQTLCGLPTKAGLETITLMALFFSFSGYRGFGESIIYNFSHKGAWKRLTMYSDFYGTVGGRQYFGVEVIFNLAGSTLDGALTDFTSHAQANGLFNGDLRLEGSMVLENAYPIYRQGAAQHAAIAIKELKQFGVESHGRQGGFNYQPTARASTVEAEAALRHQQTRTN